MGSTSTVLLSVSRWLSIGLVGLWLLLEIMKLVGMGNINQYLLMVLMLVGWYFFPEKWSNYFSSPMHPWLEILLPFGLILGMFYRGFGDGFLYSVGRSIGLINLLFVLYMFFGGGEFDRSARQSTFGF